jgi:uncharacterized membrane protein YqhA
MAKFVSATRFLAILAVISLLLAALAAFGWGVSNTVEAVALVITSLGRDAGIIVALVKVVDAFLVAIALLIFSLGLYELVIGELKLPAWMVVHNLHDLKAKLGSLLVLVMAVKFLEKLAEWKDARETLFFALSIAVIAAVLIAFSILGGKED